MDKSLVRPIAENVSERGTHMATTTAQKLIVTLCVCKRLYKWTIHMSI